MSHNFLCTQSVHKHLAYKVGYFIYYKKYPCLQDIKAKISSFISLVSLTMWNNIPNKSWTCPPPGGVSSLTNSRACAQKSNFGRTFVELSVRSSQKSNPNLGRFATSLVTSVRNAVGKRQAQMSEPAFEFPQNRATRCNHASQRSTPPQRVVTQIYLYVFKSSTAQRKRKTKPSSLTYVQP